MKKSAMMSCFCAALLVAAAAAAQQSKVTTETGFVAAVSDTKLTLSNVPLGGSPGGQWQGAGASPGQEGQPRRVVMRRGPDGQAQEVKLTPEEEAKLREQMKAGGGQTRMVVRGEDGQTRELTGEEAEKMREKMKAEGVEPHVIAVPGDGSSGAVVQRSSEPMKLSDFVVDGKTKKKGEIKVGTRVSVTYREENGQKIATNIAPAK